MCGRHSAWQLRPACEKGTESRGATVGRASGVLQKETSGLCEVFKARFSLTRAGAALCPLCPSPPRGAWLCPQPPCCSHPTTRYPKGSQRLPGLSCAKRSAEKGNTAGIVLKAELIFSALAKKKKKGVAERATRARRPRQPLPGPTCGLMRRKAGASSWPWQPRVGGSSVAASWPGSQQGPRLSWLETESAAYPISAPLGHPVLPMTDDM